MSTIAPMLGLLPRVIVRKTTLGNWPAPARAGLKAQSRARGSVRPTRASR